MNVSRQTVFIVLNEIGFHVRFLNNKSLISGQQWGIYRLHKSNFSKALTIPRSYYFVFLTMIEFNVFLILLEKRLHSLLNIILVTD